MFNFSIDSFTNHTNNVVNCCENHDENSVAINKKSNPTLNDLASKDRKGRTRLISEGISILFTN